MIRAGDYKEKITVKNPTRTSDGRGGFTTAYSSTWSTWGEGIKMKGSRALEFERLVHKAPWKIRIPLPNQTITEESLIQINSGSDLTIHSIVDVDNQHYEYEIIAYEKD